MELNSTNRELGKPSANRLGEKEVKNLQKSVSYTVFLCFCYQDGFLATWDPSQMKDLEIPLQIHLERALYDRI